MPDCAKKEDCPRAVMMGCEKCEHYITPEHYKQLKKIDRIFFTGFLSGVIFSIVITAVVVYC